MKYNRQKTIKIFAVYSADVLGAIVAGLLLAVGIFCALRPLMF